MGWRRDRISNEKIVPFYQPTTRGVGTHVGSNFDLRAGTAVVGAASGGAGREVHTNMLITLLVADAWGAGGTIDLTVWTGDTAATMALYATGARCLASENENLYLFEIRDFQRFIRVQLVVGGVNVACSVIGNADRSRREPVFQLGTEKAMSQVSSSSESSSSSSNSSSSSESSSSSSESSSSSSESSSSSSESSSSSSSSESSSSSSESSSSSSESSSSSSSSESSSSSSESSSSSSESSSSSSSSESSSSSSESSSSSDSSSSSVLG